MKVEIWSDVVCPWCYIGKRRFEAALSSFAHRDEVEVAWRSFQLDPAAPRATHQSVIELLSSKYGVSQKEATRLEQRIADLAAAEGLVIRPERFIANTFDAHRLLHLAAEHGRRGGLEGRLFTAHFAERQVVSDHDTLVRLAAEAGIDPGEARRVLGSDTYAAEVATDADEARALGANGVPFYVIDRGYAIGGAQPTEVFLRALEHAWAEHIPTASAAQGNACGPDSGAT